VSCQWRRIQKLRRRAYDLDEIVMVNNLFPWIWIFVSVNDGGVRCQGFPATTRHDGSRVIKSIKPDVGARETYALYQTGN